MAAQDFQLISFPSTRDSETQSGFDFPEPLTEKYRPRKINDFVGLDKVKRIMTKLAAKPFNSSWFFLGNSGNKLRQVLRKAGVL